MRHRSPARWLAPVALVTCAVAIYAVVQSTTKSGGSSSSSSSTPAESAPKAAAKKGKAKHKTYTVKPGDVLSAIAQKNGVTVAEIERLNPSVDAAALHPGQKLRLSQ